ncbi:ketopantoate reductase family protein [Jiella avicenniae]|uniref:2-dehydropantoate 2-reductase n=1 Tax=Jiella avicenniae TaxID=2907202 RepID=A0A9X1P112_9HYPH|nr:2-dehydropantoate 2-reductase [Jiella avicenniae]MCE7029407.1 2-dehydropantoate 2-reductase [Jiella avicenniae]
MKICIFGAGAVGGHMAIRLARGGGDVSVVMRGENLAAVRERGLELRAKGAEPFRVSLPATDKPETLGPQDVVVISVKYRALAAALKAIDPLIGPDTQIVSAMNGMPWWFAEGLPIAEDEALSALLDPGGAFGRTVPSERWTACVVTSGNMVSEPGVITNTTPDKNRLRLGTSSGSFHPLIAEFVAIAKTGGYDAEIVDDIRHQIWSKLLINAGISSVATVCEKTVAEICQNPRTRALSIGVIEEIMALGRAIGLPVDADPEAMTAPETAPPHVTSFLQDLRAGRPLEIENGILALVEMAKSSGVDTPRLEAVAAVMAARSQASVLD